MGEEEPEEPQAPVPTKPRAKANVRFEKKLKSYCVVSPDRKSVRNGQGRIWWNALCEVPRNSPEVKLFLPKDEGIETMAVGMVPPTLKGDNLSDWLGRQSSSAAVYLDGQCVQNGIRIPDVPPVPIGENGVLLEMEHTDGQFLSIFHNGQLIKQFHGIPPDWRFAVGGFGGRAVIVDDGEDSEDTKAKLVISNITAKNVPDADAAPGSGRSDVYVAFELQGGGPIVRTNGNVANATEVAAWSDPVALLLPVNFATGNLIVTAWDDDINSPDDALGGAVVSLNLAAGAANVGPIVMKGYPKPEAEDEVFPDFEVSFSVEYRNFE